MRKSVWVTRSPPPSLGLPSLEFPHPYWLCLLLLSAICPLPPTLCSGLCWAPPPPSMGELMRMTRPMGDEARIPREGPFSSRCCFLSRYRVAEPVSLPRWPREERELREPELRSPRPSGSKPTEKPCAMAARLQVQKELASPREEGSACSGLHEPSGQDWVPSEPEPSPPLPLWSVH